MLAVGVLALASYDFLFVRFYAVGPWYAPVSTVFTSLLCIYALERALDANRRKAAALASVNSTSHIARVSSWPPLPLLAVLAGFAFKPLCGAPEYHLNFAAFALDEAPLLRASLAAAKPKLIDCDDGIVAWTSGFPSLSGTGLALDVEALQAYEDKAGLLPLAVKRGYSYVTQLQDIDATSLKDDVPDHVKEWVAKQVMFTRLGDVKSYTWSVAYRSKSGAFAVVKAEVP